MRVLITGANGFVGTWLAEWLKESGDDVYCLSADIDINDEKRIASAIQDIGPEAIYHLAALSHVGDSWGNPREVFKVNALGTLNLVEVLKESVVNTRLLIISSAEVYGKIAQEDLPLTESSRLKPATPYAVSKVAAEFIGLQASLGGADILIARPFNHVGPKQSDKFVVSALAKRIVEAKRNKSDFISVGNLSSKRDYTDVRSVVKCYRLLMQKGESGQIYNICSGEARSVEDIAHKLMELAGISIEFRIDEKLARASDVPVLLGSCDKVRKAVGWDLDIDFDDTLLDTLNYWENTLDQL